MPSEWKPIGLGNHIKDFVATDGYLYRVELQEEFTEGRFWVRLRGVIDIRHFQSPNLDAAKAEALRLVREAVKRLADAVGE